MIAETVKEPVGFRKAPNRLPFRIAFFPFGTTNATKIR
jgi:hypothetical protein